MGIRSRIFAVFVIAVAMGGWVFFNWLRDDMLPRYMEAQEDILVDMARLLATQVASTVRVDEDGAATMDTTLLQHSFRELQSLKFEAQIYELLKTHSDIRVYLTDAQGMVIFDSLPGAELGRDMSEWRDVARTLKGEYGARSTQDEQFAEGSTMYIGAPVLHHGEIIGVISVGKTTRNVERFLDSAIPRIALAALATLGAALLLSLGLYRWLTRPLVQLQDYAKALQSGEPQAPPAMRDRDMAAVAHAMQELREALDGKQYIEDYVQALTHELKSPTAAISGAAELLAEDLPAAQRQRFTDNISNEAKRLNQLIERMLALAALENRSALDKPQNLDLIPLISEACESLAPLMQQKKLKLHTDTPDTLMTQGDAFLLQRALVNLLHNAMDFSPEGGNIDIQADKKNGISVGISDQGPGLPDFAGEQIYQRFWSLPRADGRKSTGLGLSFVRQIAALHQGSIEIRNREPGGAVATLKLPLST